jgi:uncharacterized protein
MEYLNYNIDLEILVLVVLVFSVIQSIFGVGLLLFGTPTLLLFGLPYDVTLWTILPSSIAISAIQAISSYKLVMYKKDVVFYTLPFLIISLMFIIAYDSVVDIKKLVGSMMILIGLIKFSDYLNTIINTIVKKNMKIYHVIMGIIHGVSNMGGGPLSILMTAIHKDKYTIRANIAFVYMLFGISQLIILWIMKTETFQLNGIFLIAVSIVSYFYVGRILASIINENKYKLLITILILSYGIISFL